MAYDSDPQKGIPEKPNTNAEGMIDEAADPVDEQAIAPDNAEFSRAVAAPDNEMARDRPEH